MGQYYRTLVEGRNKKVYIIEEMGAVKLMEHSYIGNDLPEFVASLLDHTRVVWMGDYADEHISPGKGDRFASRVEDRVRVFDDDIHRTLANLYEFRMQPADACHLLNIDDPLGWIGDGAFPAMPRIRKVLDKGYLVNEDKLEYIAMRRYCRDNWHDKKHRFIISPLPLLTAIGNGAGCGDYWGLNQDCVGLWAWDRLTYRTTKPGKEYADKTGDYSFFEE
ncbi:MAG: hypothetical protein EOM65_04815 [Synergistales bacterium]|nr:hypothetical protein [Synergistales bacterium]